MASSIGEVRAACTYAPSERRYLRCTQFAWPAKGCKLGIFKATPAFFKAGNLEVFFKAFKFPSRLKLHSTLLMMV